jgi:hypothetical protein
VGHATARPSCRPSDFDADIGDLRGFLDIVVSVAALLERFPAKWIPVRVKKTRQNK